MRQLNQQMLDYQAVENVVIVWTNWSSQLNDNKNYICE